MEINSLSLMMLVPTFFLEKIQILKHQIYYITPTNCYLWQFPAINPVHSFYLPFTWLSVFSTKPVSFDVLMVFSLCCQACHAFVDAQLCTKFFNYSYFTTRSPFEQRYQNTMCFCFYTKASFTPPLTKLSPIFQSNLSYKLTNYVDNDSVHI